MSNDKTYPHYFKQLPEGTTHVDIYMVLSLYKVTDAAVAHAVKKLLCAGQRGAKDQVKDLTEARDSINRALDIMAACEKRKPPIMNDHNDLPITQEMLDKIRKGQGKAKLTADPALSTCWVLRIDLGGGRVTTEYTTIPIHRAATEREIKELAAYFNCTITGVEPHVSP
jgi:hypothetical protein